MKYKPLQHSKSSIIYLFEIVHALCIDYSSVKIFFLMHYWSRQSPSLFFNTSLTVYMVLVSSWRYVITKIISFCDPGTLLSIFDLKFYSICCCIISYTSYVKLFSILCLIYNFPIFTCLYASPPCHPIYKYIIFPFLLMFHFSVFYLHVKVYLFWRKYV